MAFFLYRAGGMVAAAALVWGVGVAFRTRKRNQDYQLGGRRLLWALRGMLHSGIGLTEALESLAATLTEDPFSRQLHRALGQWRGGIALERAIAPLQIGDLGPVLRALVAAYYQGGATLPLLDEWLPRLERQADYHRRASQLRAALGVQCVLVVSLPWGVGMWMGGLPSVGVGLAIAVWQGLGLGVVWRVSRA